MGAQVAPVIPRDQPPRAPTRPVYASAHGIPRAFGGGVCPLSTPHPHSYPPVPRAAYRETPAGLVDTRTRYAYFNPHPHHQGPCFIEGWHLHLRPPLPSLRYQPRLGVYAAQGPVALERYAGAHPPRACDAVPCTETQPHGHVACSVRTSASQSVGGAPKEKRPR